MSQHHSIQIDTVSIAEGLRSLATVIDAFPDDYASRAFTDQPVIVPLLVDSPEAVRQWARIVAEPIVTVRDRPDSVRTRVVATFLGVRLEVFHIADSSVRMLRRPVEVDDALIGSVA